MRQAWRMPIAGHGEIEKTGQSPVDNNGAIGEGSALGLPGPKSSIRIESAAHSGTDVTETKRHSHFVPIPD
jgi:hypothetical protein